MTTVVDGFGRRTIGKDSETGDEVELLDLSPALVEHSGFVTALAERVARFATVRHASYVHLRRLDRPAEDRLQLVSDLTPGWRLSELLEESAAANIPIDITVVIGLLRQLLPAVALFGRHNRDAAIGALAAERLIVTPQARLVVAEHAFGPALEKLNLGREKLWRELRVAMPPSAGLPRSNQRSDANGLGMVALTLLIGRVLTTDEFPSQLPALVDGAVENRDGTPTPLSTSLRNWLTRALQFDVRTAFQSPSESQLAFESVLASDRTYVTSSTKLEQWVAQVGGAIDVRRPRPAPAPPPPDPAELERERERELERQRELERAREQEEERQRELERLREQERQREAELERLREQERERARELELLREQERAREEEREAERQRQQQREQERERELEEERARARERDAERERELEQERERVRAAEERALQQEQERERLEREREQDQDRDRLERERDQERQRAREEEREHAAHEEERAREEERERERARERDREAERERELERERQRVRDEEEAAAIAAYRVPEPAAPEVIEAATPEAVEDAPSFAHEAPEPEALESEAPPPAPYVPYTPPTPSPVEETPPDDAPVRSRSPLVYALAGVVILLIAAVGWLATRGSGGLGSGDGQLVVTSRPEGAQVTVDGTVRGKTPLTVSLSAGAHVLEVQAGKSEPRVIPLTITAGVQTAQYVELQGAAAMGGLDVRSDPPGARVIIDGQNRGTTPVVVGNLTPGDHSVVLEAGGRKVTQAVRIEAGITAQLVVPMRR